MTWSITKSNLEEKERNSSLEWSSILETNLKQGVMEIRNYGEKNSKSLKSK